jgi:hypothetical protein
VAILLVTIVPTREQANTSIESAKKARELAQGIECSLGSNRSGCNELDQCILKRVADFINKGRPVIALYYIGKCNELTLQLTPLESNVEADNLYSEGEKQLAGAEQCFIIELYDQAFTFSSIALAKFGLCHLKRMTDDQKLAELLNKYRALADDADSTYNILFGGM